MNIGKWNQDDDESKSNLLHGSGGGLLFVLNVNGRFKFHDFDNIPVLFYFRVLSKTSAKN